MQLCYVQNAATRYTAATETTVARYLLRTLLVPHCRCRQPRRPPAAQSWR